MKRKFKLTMPLISLFLTLHLFTYGGGFNSPIYVKITATGSGDGSSWTNAMTNLQLAIDSADVGDTIYVAAGKYLPTRLLGGDPVRSLTFYISKDVVIYGGFSGEPGTEGSTTDRDPKLNLTTLSGDTGTPSDRSDNVFHVVYFDHVSDTTRLDGFIIADGNSFGGGGFDGTGTGIFNNATVTRSNPIIANCIIRNCSAQESGGGMANYAADGGTGNPWLINCSFQNNDGSGGGGIMNYTDTEGEA
ncbi:MAG TPA: hypothetical protein VGK46_02170, partial [Saprospiraceae bacterium]